MNAATGVAVREFVTPLGRVDYLLFVLGKAAGSIEAVVAELEARNGVNGAAEQDAVEALIEHE